MKKTFKKISSLLLAAVMVLGVSATAFADDSVITFKGAKNGFEFAPGSEYTQSDLFDGFKNVMPGDTLTETITIKNEDSGSDYIEVYMKVIPHDDTENPLTYDEEYENTDGKDQAGIEGQRDETVASMSDFLSKLTMRIYNDDELIYESSPEKSGALADKVELGELERKESIELTVELDVPIELGNEYANRVGEVDWIFSAETGSSDPEPINLTVKKIWDDDDNSDRPESVNVHLLRNGLPFKEVELSEENAWTHTWTWLEGSYIWTAEEDVPEGYTASYKKIDSTVFITNTLDGPILPPPPPPPPTPPVVTPDPETGDMSVTKVWDDNNNPNRPENISITLLRDGESYSEIELSEENAWSYTWNGLTEGNEWSIKEAEYENYDVSYAVEGSAVVITNHFDYMPSKNITVKKVWDDEDNKDKMRPNYATVVLYNGTEEVEKITLGEWNSWTYVWENLDAEGNWSVIETGIPGGYTPSYSTDEDVVVITNTAALIQTGQTNWPIPVLGSLGALIIILGVTVIRKKRNGGNV